MLCIRQAVKRPLQIDECLLCSDRSGRLGRSLSIARGSPFQTSRKSSYPFTILTRRRFERSIPYRRFYSTGEWCTKTEKQQAKLLKTAQAKVEIYRTATTQESHGGSVQEQIERSKIIKELKALNEAWTSYVNLRKAILDIIPHLSDPDDTLREMFSEEHDSLCSQLDELTTTIIPRLLLPQPSTASLPAVMSVNAGVGGSESALFAEELVRMYTRFAEKRGWKIEVISQVEGAVGRGNGGLKEMTIKFSGPVNGDVDNDDAAVYGLLQWERGVHRVQRVPATETMGRVHTSTVAVVVLPLYPDRPDAPLVDPKDVKTEVMRSRGAGGQHVNKTESAVRLTHIPTGISVSMQDSRSQHQNRAWAWEVLRARLSERKHAEEVEARRASRRNQVKGADRSDKVRTYNFPQDRLTDHRVGLTLTGLQNILDGDGLNMVITALKDDLESRRLESLLQGDDDLDY